MTLDGAIKLSEFSDYVIYTMNSASTGQYCVVIPNNVHDVLNMLVDLHMKNSFDSVRSGNKTKEQLVSEIKLEYDKLKSKFSNGMLVMPMVDESMLQSAILAGDKQKMFDEVKKIGAITSELYKKLTDSGVDKQKIDQKIIIVEKNDQDIKFVEWLKEQMPNFVDGVKFEELNVQQTINPFVNNNSLFGPEPVETKVNNVVPNVGGGIFDNVAPVTSNVTINPTTSVETVNATDSSMPVSGVETQKEVVVAANTSVTPIEENIPGSNVDIFGIPTNVQGVVSNPDNVTNVSSVDNTTSVAGAGTNIVQPQIVEAPKPVDSTSLESTMTLNTINESENNNAVEEENKSNKGFANLLILLVVLVGVTIVSIELGKFLYNTFGA